jgi:hypothetical protein
MKWSTKKNLTKRYKKVYPEDFCVPVSGHVTSKPQSLTQWHWEKIDKVWARGDLISVPWNPPEILGAGAIFGIAM